MAIGLQNKLQNFSVSGTGMRRNTIWIYTILALVILLPSYHVWAHLPDVLSADDEKRQDQVYAVILISAIPLIFTLIVFRHLHDK